MHRLQTSARRGFTLIELLVVLSIIAVLASLIAAATFKALSAGKTLEERDDIRMLSEGIAAFKAHFQIDRAPPSYVTLSESPSGDQNSIAFLHSLYPNPGFSKNFAAGKIKWTDTGEATLQGHQALVFWLGGPQRGGKPIGWSTNSVDPVDVDSSGTPRGERKIFANFRMNRLYGPRGSPNLAYWNPSESQPYAYFSPRFLSGGTFNYYDGDCNALGVNPYGGKSPQGYMNRDTFQIIGPGADGIFGSMGPTWTPQRPYPHGDAGADDLANFHSAVLGGR